jgi:hypothetical protein
VPLDQRSTIRERGVAEKALELRAQGHSLQTIADQLSSLFPGAGPFTKSTVFRHLRKQEKDYDKAAGAGAKRKRFKRNESATPGRCASCGFSSEATDAASIVRRSERLLWVAEGIAARAQADNDARLALMAVDRGNKSLELLARETGVIGGDGVTVNIDQRKVEIATAAVQSLPTPVLEIVRLNPTDAEIYRAIEVIMEGRLSLPPALETAEIPS